MTRIVGIQNNLAVPLTRLYESITSSHLALRVTHNIPTTQTSAPSAPLGSSLGMHARDCHDKDLENTDSSGMIVDNDKRTPLISSNRCMLNSDTNSHNHSLI